MGKIHDAIKKAQSQSKGSTDERAIEAVAPAARVTGISTGSEEVRPIAGLDASDRIDFAAPSVRFDTQSFIAAGLLDVEYPHVHLSYQYRRLRNAMIGGVESAIAADNAFAEIIVITSARSGEGRTFIATNLAMSLCQSGDLDVVLVDGDFANPCLSSILFPDGAAGLSDVMSDEDREVADLVYPTDIRGLYVLPAGNCPSKYEGGVDDARLDAVFADIHRACAGRLVIVDAPAVVSTNFASQITKLAGHSVLVVRSGVTSRQDASNAIEKSQNNLPVSIVFNAVPAVLP